MVGTSENKFTKLNAALYDQEFKNGLDRYEQGNCKCYLTDDGYRIYRPPNIIYDGTAATRTMWGGLVIRPFSDDDNFLIQGHTYIMMFQVEGQSSCDIETPAWSNNCGWGGAAYGLTTNPTNVSYNRIGADFLGRMDFYYKFTVNDAVYETATGSYSSFVSGNSYNCYRDFKFGFTYQNTGTMGTDLYLSRFRMYDITEPTKVSFNKSGVINLSNLVELPPPIIPEYESLTDESGNVLADELGNDLTVETEKNNVRVPRIMSSGEVQVLEFIEW